MPFHRGEEGWPGSHTLTKSGRSALQQAHFNAIA